MQGETTKVEYKRRGQMVILYKGRGQRGDTYKRTKGNIKGEDKKEDREKTKGEYKRRE